MILFFWGAVTLAGRAPEHQQECYLPCRLYPQAILLRSAPHRAVPVTWGTDAPISFRPFPQLHSRFGSLLERQHSGLVYPLYLSSYSCFNSPTQLLNLFLLAFVHSLYITDSHILHILQISFLVHCSSLALSLHSDSYMTMSYRNVSM